VTLPVGGYKLNVLSNAIGVSVSVKLWDWEDQTELYSTLKYIQNTSKFLN